MGLNGCDLDVWRFLLFIVCIILYMALGIIFSIHRYCDSLYIRIRTAYRTCGGGNPDS